MGKALARLQAQYGSYRSFDDYQLRQKLRTAEGRAEFYRQHAVEHSSRTGYKVRSYRSGEVTGAQFTTGRQGKIIPSPRQGELVTDGFTVQSKVKIRRAVECADTFLGKFCTLTFAPAELKPWHFDEKGCVRHDFAKWKLKKFLDACSVKQRRLGRVLNYVWVAELQENGNIHFHILWDQFFDIKWLTKVWAQANNSVDIQRMNNPVHASRYMRKYMTKDESCEIRGNRYNISAGLRATMKPIEKLIADITASEAQQFPEAAKAFSDLRQTLLSLQDDIEERGGTVLDFGFSIPMPRASVEYITKSGEKKRSKGVDPRLGKGLINLLVAQGRDIPALCAPF
jgi:hypothetical protein